jgi:hypothetical protein
MSNIIIVSNRLPVTVGEEIKKSAGGVRACFGRGFGVAM